MTDPANTILIANAAGRVVGTHTIQAATAPVRTLNLAAKGNIAMIAGSVVVAAFIALLEMFDEERVNKSIQDWQLASKYLINQDGSFDQALPRLIESKLPDDAWKASDREEFDKFINRYINEITAVATACDLNAEALEKARDAFHNATDMLVMALIPILVAVIASIAMQFFPPTAPAAEAVGIAGAVAAIGTVAALATYLVSALSSLAPAVNASSAAHFTSESHPGDVPPGAKDPTLQDITITWVHDDAYYKTAQ
jgi:hypothetical protein